MQNVLEVGLAPCFANKQCMDLYLAVASRTSSNLPASKLRIYQSCCKQANYSRCRLAGHSFEFQLSPSDSYPNSLAAPPSLFPHEFINLLASLRNLLIFFTHFAISCVVPPVA
jgi:hypothetical protein